MSVIEKYLTFLQGLSGRSNMACPTSIHIRGNFTHSTKMRVPASVHRVSVGSTITRAGQHGASHHQPQRGPGGGPDCLSDVMTK